MENRYVHIECYRDKQKVGEILIGENEIFERTGDSIRGVMLGNERREKISRIYSRVLGLYEELQKSDISVEYRGRYTLTVPLEDISKIDGERIRSGLKALSELFGSPVGVKYQQPKLVVTIYKQT